MSMLGKLMDPSKGPVLSHALALAWDAIRTNHARSKEGGASWRDELVVGPNTHTRPHHQGRVQIQPPNSQISQTPRLLPPLG